MNFLIIPFILIFSFPIFAQSLPQSDTQLWNDLTITKSIVRVKEKQGKEFDKVSVFYSGTFRFGNHLKTLVDERIGFGIDFKLNKFLSLTPSYLYRTNKPNLNSREYESRFRFAATLENKWTKFSVKDRNLVEYRLRNSHPDSVRFRNKLTFAYPILLKKKEIFAPFIADEPYYDFKEKRWTRNEISIGITRRFTKNFSADFYYLRQDNRRGTPKSVNVFAISIKINIH